MFWTSNSSIMNHFCRLPSRNRHPLIHLPRNSNSNFFGVLGNVSEYLNHSSWYQPQNSCSEILHLVTSTHLFVNPTFSSYILYVTTVRKCNKLTTSVTLLDELPASTTICITEISYVTVCQVITLRTLTKNTWCNLSQRLVI